MKFLRLSLGVFLFCSLSCRDHGTEPPPNTSSVQLTAEDVHVTEAWMSLQLTQAKPHNSVVFTRDDSTIHNFYFLGADTVLYDSRLLPNHAYRYKAYSFNNLILQDSSAVLAITTMDTTSHDFAWEITTVGNSFGLLWDVAIVNDTCAWAVGEIYNYDSAGQIDPTLYNAARWNGKAWKFLNISFPIYNYDCTYAGSVHGELYSVFTFPSGSMNFDAGIIMKGDTITYLPCVPFALGGRILKTWGTSEADFYAVGQNGTIIHYNGISWEKLESGTTLDIRDVFGAKNAKTGGVEVMAVASKEYENYDRAILLLSGMTVTRMSDSGIDYPLMGVWFMPGRRYYVAGGEIYSKKNPLDNSRWGEESGLGEHYRNAIRGNDLNEVVVVGDYGDVLHFNGITWKNYPEAAQLNGLYHSVAIHGNLVVAVGENSNAAVVAIGRR